MNQQDDERQQLAVVKTVLSTQNIISHALLQKNTKVKQLVAGWEVELVCLYVVLTNASNRVPGKSLLMSYIWQTVLYN